MPASVRWKEFTAEELRAKAAADAIVILPVASMEQHGPHLPVGVDTILTEAVCRAGAEAAARDVAVVVAPTIWCGMAERHVMFGHAAPNRRSYIQFRHPDLSCGAAHISQKHRAEWL